MIKYFKRHKLLLIFHVLATAFAAFMTVCIAFVYQALAEAATQGELDYFILISICTVIYFLLEAVSDYLPRLTLVRLMQTISDTLRNDLVSHYLQSDIEKLMKEKSSVRVSSLVNDIQVVESSYISEVLFAIQLVFIFVFALTASFLLNGVFTAIMLVLAIIPLFSPYLSKKILSEKKLVWQEQKNKYLGTYENYSNHLPFIRFTNSENIFYEKLKKESEKTKELAIKFGVAQEKTFTITYALGNIVYSGAWIVGGFFVLYGKLSLPELIAMVTLMGSIAGPINAFSNCYTEISATKGIKDKLLETINEEKKSLVTTKLLSEKIETIKLKDISYFVKDRKILESLNFTFETGKKYAIKGESGSGKSTLLKLLLGVSSSPTGYIKINKEMLSNLNINDYYSSVAYIPQKTAIFDGSIADNISMFRSFNTKKIESSLKAVGLNFMHERPHDYIYKKLDLSNILSGGEERRLDIARGLYSEADLLIFDEPTTGLDTINERLIGSIIKNIKNKIIIVVTHSEDPVFLDSFDSLLYLEGGKIRLIKKDY